MGGEMVTAKTIERLRITMALSVLFIALPIRVTAQAAESSVIKKAELLPVIEFELSMKRIRPATITVPAGQYEIRVLNGLYMRDLVIAVEAQDTNKRLATNPVPLKAHRQRLQMDLKPGKYNVFVVDRADLQGTIEVTVH